MVKGVARRVVVLTSPDPKHFEQAIFLLREDALDSKAPEEQVLKQAQEVANAYLQRSSPRHRRRRFLVPRRSVSSFPAFCPFPSDFLSGILGYPHRERGSPWTI